MKKEPSPETLAELAALDAMPDEAIDTSDARELSEAEWDDPRRRRPRYTAPAVQLAIDSRVTHWFETSGSGEPPEQGINRVLLEYVREQQRRPG